MDLSTLHKLVLERCSADHKRAGVELDKDPVGFEEAAKRRRSLGRYTIEEAALFTAIEGPANYESILYEITASIAQGSLNSYWAGKNGIFRGDGVTYVATQEVYDRDMNAWLETNQHRIGAIFPVVSVLPRQNESTVGSGPVRHVKLRTGKLDHLIEKAIDKTGGANHHEIYYALEEMILEGENILPFTGAVDGGLWYKDQNDKVKPLTLDALRQRMKRRQK